MRKTVFTLLITSLLVASALAQDTYRQGQIVKWENDTYAEHSKNMKNWIIYQLQTENTTYSMARQKETKPQMQAGETVQYELTKNNTRIKLVDANGKHHDYRIVGQAAGPAQ